MTQSQPDLLKLEKKAIRAFNKVIATHDYDYDDANAHLLTAIGAALQGIAAIRSQRLQEENRKRPRAVGLAPAGGTDVAK